VLLGQLGECLVQGKEVVGDFLDGELNGIKVQALAVASPFEPSALASLLN
jgi:hypothetical protein